MKKNISSYYFRGNSLFKFGDLYGAKLKYEKSINEEPDFVVLASTALKLVERRIGMNHECCPSNKNNNFINNLDMGVVLVAFGVDYETIAPKLVRSIRRFSNIPVLVHTNIVDEYRSKEWGDMQNVSFCFHNLNDSENRLIKTRLSKYTSFEYTLYIDVDSEVLSSEFLKPFEFLRDGISIICPIWNTFSVDDLKNRANKNNKFKKFYRVVQENNINDKVTFCGGGVCYFKKNESIDFFESFYRYWIDSGRLEDMPALNKAIIENRSIVHIVSNNLYNGVNSKVIRSLHSSTDTSAALVNFTRRRYDAVNDVWAYVKQGTETLFKKPKILLVYDVDGWAFYNMSWAIKYHLNKSYEVDLCPVLKLKNSDLSSYDLILLHSYSFLKFLDKAYYSRCIIGFQSHKRNVYDQYSYIDFCFANDIDIFKKLKSDHKFYIPNGVNTSLFQFKNRRHCGGKLKLGCVGSAKWAKHKGKGRLSDIVAKTNSVNKGLFVDSENALSQHEMVRYYDEIDILIVSSESETGPMPLLEAVSSGIPCIANDVGLVRDVILHGVNGFIVRDFENIDEYAIYVEKMRDPNFYFKMSEACNSIRKKISWKERSVNYQLLFDEFLEYSNRSC